MLQTSLLYKKNRHMNSINFFKTTKSNTNRYIQSSMSLERMRGWRLINGCPDVVNAAYDGYTGAKMFKFPTSDKLNKLSYPDITKEYESFKKGLLYEIEEAKSKPFGTLKVYMLFLKKFATGASWDTKFLPEFPGRDANGMTQFAKYNGKVVKGNYISNCLYGYLCAAIGMPEKQAKAIARIYSCGVIEPFITHKFPDRKLIMFRDPIDDQKAISCGYKEFFADKKLKR